MKDVVFLSLCVTKLGHLRLFLCFVITGNSALMKLKKESPMFRKTLQQTGYLGLIHCLPSTCTKNSDDFCHGL